MEKISRRRLLRGGAIAATSVPILHELIPHQGLHGSEAAAKTGHGQEHSGPGGHSGFQPGRRVDHSANGFNPTEVLRDFDWGKTRRLPGGRTLREWTLVAQDKEIEVAPGVKFAAWAYNGRVPGPTLRCREGELLRVEFINASAHPHTIHFHG